jgi:xanthine/CO dehydrogenase XdhC/CoxF family maturation factor
MRSAAEKATSRGSRSVYGWLTTAAVVGLATVTVSWCSAPREPGSSPSLIDRGIDKGIRL